MKGASIIQGEIYAARLEDRGQIVHIFGFFHIRQCFANQNNP